MINLISLTVIRRKGTAHKSDGIELILAAFVLVVFGCPLLCFAIFYFEIRMDLHALTILNLPEPFPLIAAGFMALIVLFNWFGVFLYISMFLLYIKSTCRTVTHLM